MAARVRRQRIACVQGGAGSQELIDDAARLPQGTLRAAAGGLALPNADRCQPKSLPAKPASRIRPFGTVSPPSSPSSKWSRMRPLPRRWCRGAKRSCGGPWRAGKLVDSIRLAKAGVAASLSCPNDSVFCCPFSNWPAGRELSLRPLGSSQRSLPESVRAQRPSSSHSLCLCRVESNFGECVASQLLCKPLQLSGLVAPSRASWSVVLERLSLC